MTSKVRSHSVPGRIYTWSKLLPAMCGGWRWVHYHHKAGRLLGTSEPFGFGFRAFDGDGKPIGIFADRRGAEIAVAGAAGVICGDRA